jgi:hypothetical protein
LNEDVNALPDNDPFLGALLKTKWAYHHVKDINDSIFATFFHGRTYQDAVAEEPYSATEGKVPEMRRVNRVREDIILLATYAIHNLRSALDHVACAISSAPKRHEAAFVIADCVDEFERVCAKREKQLRLCADSIAFMRSFKPYKGGCDKLWVLNRLNIMDKHRMLIFVEPRGQKRLINDPSPVDYAAPGWETFEGRPDFYSSPLPGHPDAKTQTAFSVAFDKIETIENRPIEIVVGNLATLIEKIIGEARKGFPYASVPPF